MSDDRERDLARILVGGMVGGACGALVGLVVFGGVIFVPVLFMGLGVWIGIAQAAKHMDMDSPTRRMLRAAFRHQPPPLPEPRIKATKRRQEPPRASAYGATSSPSHASSSSSSSGGRVTGPVRTASPRSDLPPIDLNSADADELSRLPGVGRAAAARIVAHREQHGPFASLRELEAVEGFDGARVARLAARATLSPARAGDAGRPVAV